MLCMYSLFEFPLSIDFQISFRTEAKTTNFPLGCGQIETAEMLQCDLDFQTDQITLLRSAIALAEQEQDYVSRELLNDILEYEEEHVDWIETQQSLIHNIGLANYLQSMMEE